MKIINTGYEIRVIEGFKTDLGSDKTVTAIVDLEKNTLNLGLSGELNTNGRAALKRAIAVAEAILESGSFEY